MVTIRLLGPPVIERDGRAITLRGQKAWGLLVYLLVAGHGKSRQHLGELLFGEADDPLGALRWTLSELRRAVGDSSAFTGDPVAVNLPSGTTIDLDLITSNSDDPSPLLTLGGELLEGIWIKAGAAFESWLVVERHRWSAAAEARQRRAAQEQLSMGRPESAMRYASLALARNPLDETNHELLVACLAASGDRDAALEQVAVCQSTLLREFGVEPSPTLRAAALVGRNRVASPVSGKAAAQSQLDAGRAAILAGAVEAGIDCLRRAVAEAERSEDPPLRAKTLAALGEALVHAVRGHDGEGALALHQAARVALDHGDTGTAAGAYRELGFVEVQAGRRRNAETWLANAEDLSEGDDQLSAVAGIRGMNASDSGDYPAAFEHLLRSVGLARSCGDRRQEGWSLSILARAHLLRDERDQAEDALERSLELVRQERWMAFLPWPQVLKGELELRLGRTIEATDELEQAWALACQLGDPCWEGMAARGIGLIHAARGEGGRAHDWLAEAGTRCNRVTDRYQWIRAHVLDTFLSMQTRPSEETLATIETMGRIAARSDMRELVVRSLIHRGRLEDPKALDAARLLADDIDNPALHRLLAG